MGNMVGVKFFVVVGCADKEKSSSSDNRAAIIFRASVAQSCGSERRIVAKGNFPEIFASVEVDGIQSSPRRGDCGTAVRVEKTVVAGNAIFLGRWQQSAGGQVLALAVG